jgi:hypothetical protein
MVAEMRAVELVRALTAAVQGATHWRLEAQNLLTLIDAGVPPIPLREQFQQQLEKEAA